MILQLASKGGERLAAAGPRLGLDHFPAPMDRTPEPRAMTGIPARSMTRTKETANAAATWTSRTRTAT